MKVFIFIVVTAISYLQCNDKKITNRPKNINVNDTCNIFEFQRFSTSTANVTESFFKDIKNIEGIDSINKHFDTVKVFCSQQYFDGAGNLGFCWCYLYYNDFYSSIFKFEKINYVQIFLNGDNHTYFPLIGDYDGIFPSGKTMKKTYYKQKMNISNLVNLDDSSNYINFEERELRALK